MAFARQVVDIVIGGLIAGLASAVASRIAVTAGGLFASMFHFSRNPWAARNPGGIDEVYDRYLPFWPVAVAGAGAIAGRVQ